MNLLYFLKGHKTEITGHSTMTEVETVASIQVPLCHPRCCFPKQRSHWGQAQGRITWAGAESLPLNPQSNRRLPRVTVHKDHCYRREQSQPSLLLFGGPFGEALKHPSQHTHLVVLITSCEFSFPERNISQGNAHKSNFSSS